jgi:hypothetical protein
VSCALAGFLAIPSVPAAAAVLEAAEGKPEAAILPITYGGKGFQDRRATLDSALLEGFRRGGAPFVDPAAVTAAHPDVGACGTMDCTATIGRLLGVRFVVRSRVEVTGRDYDISLEIVDATTGEVAAKTSERCEVCGLSEAGELMTAEAAALGTKLLRLLDPSAHVRIESTPAGALVRVDGRDAGRTPLELDLPAGKHSIVLAKDGHLEAERSIDAVGGVEERFVFDLPPRSRMAGPEPWGWVTLGAGLAATLVGAVLLAVDERPYRRDCSGENVDADGTCRFRLDTLTGGAVTVSAGLALTGAGIGLVAHARRKRARATASLRPGGLQVRF